MNGPRRFFVDPVERPEDLDLDQERCRKMVVKSTGERRQCRRAPVPGGKYCKWHDGNNNND